MSKAINYAVITPARDEEKHLPLTISSMVAQTIQPASWIIVNDGSTDRTGCIAREAARLHSWIRVIDLPDRGFRQAGGGVVDAFCEGFRLVESEPWDYLVKLDSDLTFDTNYFEQCFKQFDQNPRLGIAGGTICNRIGGAIEVESKVDPHFHVRGATKIYRRACWGELGGLIHSPGWDTLDEVKANMLGWVTCTLPGINAIHHRPAGAAYGTWNNWVKGGIGNYITGYHPLFMLLKGIKRMAAKPYFIGGCGLLFGFIKGYVSRIPQVKDQALIKYFHKQQMNRLLFRKSLWS